MEWSFSDFVLAVGVIVAGFAIGISSYLITSTEVLVFSVVVSIIVYIAYRYLLVHMGKETRRKERVEKLQREKEEKERILREELQQEKEKEERMWQKKLQQEK